MDEEGIHTVDDKIAAVANFPQPKTVENVKSFAARASPLTKLLKKREPFHWGSEQDNSF